MSNICFVLPAIRAMYLAFYTTVVNLGLVTLTIHFLFKIAYSTTSNGEFILFWI